MQQIEFVKIYKRKHCLVIDDFPDFRLTVKKMLVNFGVEHVDMAANGEEAVAACLNRHYDIVLSDYNLGGGKTGQQVLEELRYKNALKPSTLYVMITAEMTRGQVFGALEYQPDAYIAKPITPTLLKQRLDRLVLEQEAMLPVYQAMEKGDFSQAIHQCESRMQDNPRFRSLCMRTLAQLYMQAGQLAEARALYQEAQADRRLEWAELGLVRVDIAEGNYDEAERRLTDCEANNSQCMEVYDCLATVYEKQHRLSDAKAALERGLSVSPQAILRHRRLAEVSENLGDWQGAETSRRRVLRLAAHSTYEGLENAVALVNCVSGMLQDEERKDTKKLNECLDLLKKSEQKYRADGADKVRCLAAATRVLLANGERDRALQQLEQAQNMAVPVTEAGGTAAIELAQALMAVGDKHAAHELLAEVIAAHPGDAYVARRVDQIAEFPMSDDGKAVAVRLNRQGKALFDEKRYQEAIRFFEDARAIYPNHIALVLNQLMAMVRFAGESGTTPELLAQGDKLLRRLGDLPESHEHHQRLMRLRQQFEGLAQGAAR